MSATLWGSFCAATDRVPDRAALISIEGSHTFVQLRRRAEDYRAFLAGHGVRSGDRVLLWVENSFEIAAALAGSWGAGATPAILDASVKEAQLTHALALVEPRVLLFDRTAPPQVASTIPWFGSAQIPRDAEVSAVAPSPDTPSSIVFTSGSTGKPKGVYQAQGNLLRGSRAVANYLGVRDDDRILCPVPWAFDYGFVQLHLTLLHGISQIFVPGTATPFSVCDALTKLKPTVFAGLPSLYTYLLRGVSPLAKTDVTSVRLLTSSGGAIPRAILDDLQKTFAAARVHLNYGLTETYRSAHLLPEELAQRYPAIGRPIPGADLCIVREDGSIAADDEEGEIVHRGDYICLGYWNNPEATARAIRPDPKGEGARALFTGDLGWRDAEGYFHFRGRRDHQIKSMGVRVSPNEVEALLHESGLVREVAVFGVAHEMLGQEVWAAIAPNAGIVDAQKHLIAYARKTMSPYMQPRRWVIHESLPRTTTGKIDYTGLRAAAEQAPSARLS